LTSFVSVYIVTGLQNRIRSSLHFSFTSFLQNCEFCFFWVSFLFHCLLYLFRSSSAFTSELSFIKNILMQTFCLPLFILFFFIVEVFATLFKHISFCLFERDNEFVRGDVLFSLFFYPFSISSYIKHDITYWYWNWKTLAARGSRHFVILTGQESCDKFSPLLSVCSAKNVGSSNFLWPLFKLSWQYGSLWYLEWHFCKKWIIIIIFFSKMKQNFINKF